MLVFAETPSPRARYVIGHVIERMLGWPLVWAASAEEFRASSGPKLHYGNTEFHGACRVPDSGWLEIGKAKGSNTAIGNGAELRFAVVEGEHDLFASIFHLLALVDEFSATIKDAHGRVPAEALSIVQHGAEGFPLVDIWVMEWASSMRMMFPGLPAPKRRYVQVLTVDVDNGLKYAGRPLFRAVGASAKDLLRKELSTFKERWRTRTGSTKDPYAVLPERLASVRSEVDRMLTFFLVQGNGPHDHAADLQHPAFHALLAATSAVSEVGLHPSYDSSVKDGLYVREKHLLESALGRKVTATRQHFLRNDPRITYRTLLDLGWSEDHTLGFSDRLGFRAGTCTPFPWYDLEREEETSLLLHPFSAMDSAAIDQLGLAPDETVQVFKEISDRVRAVGGTFTSVWHDRYLSGHGAFHPWPAVMEQVVQNAKA